MSDRIINDGGAIDPYTRTVEQFLTELCSRFPLDRSQEGLVLELRSNLEAKETLIEETDFTQVGLLFLLSSTDSMQVPRRDKALLAELWRESERIAKLLAGPAKLVQTSLKEAYLDSVREERASMAKLADLRDSVFASGAGGSTLQEFLYSLKELVRIRRERGYPAWRELESLCRELHSELQRAYAV